MIAIVLNPSLHCSTIVVCLQVNIVANNIYTFCFNCSRVKTNFAEYGMQWDISGADMQRRS